jgi:phosphotriesterase-related protein
VNTVTDEVVKLLENWYPTHLFDNVVPVLQTAAISNGCIDAIFTVNPKRHFGG